MFSGLCAKHGPNLSSSGLKPIRFNYLVGQVLRDEVDHPPLFTSTHCDLSVVHSGLFASSFDLSNGPRTGTTKINLLTHGSTLLVSMDVMCLGSDMTWIQATRHEGIGRTLRHVVHRFDMV